MRRLARPLLILLAIIFLIEAWLWRHLEPVVAGPVRWIVACIPLRGVKTWIAGTVRQLPPPVALVIFLVPALLLFPFKLLGLWLLAKKQWFAAGLVLLLAKLVGVAVTAFVFEVSKPKLLQMAWFRWVYDLVLRWLAWAHAITEPIKQRIKSLLRLFGPKRAGRTLRLLWRIRRRMNAARAVPEHPG